MKHIARLFTPRFLAVLVLTLAALLPAGSAAAEPVKKGKLTHVGLIWLKNAGNPADQQRIIDSLRQFAREIPEVQSLSVGKAHPSTSKLIDSSFDVCFTMQFDDQAALDRYAKHTVHEKAAQEIFLPLSQRILFYDFITE